MPKLTDRQRSETFEAMGLDRSRMLRMLLKWQRHLQALDDCQSMKEVAAIRQLVLADRKLNRLEMAICVRKWLSPAQTDALEVPEAYPAPVVESAKRRELEMLRALAEV